MLPRADDAGDDVETAGIEDRRFNKEDVDGGREHLLMTRKVLRELDGEEGELGDGESNGDEGVAGKRKRNHVLGESVATVFMPDACLPEEHHEDGRVD